MSRIWIQFRSEHLFLFIELRNIGYCQNLLLIDLMWENIIELNLCFKMYMKKKLISQNENECIRNVFFCPLPINCYRNFVVVVNDWKTRLKKENCVQTLFNREHKTVILGRRETNETLPLPSLLNGGISQVEEQGQEKPSLLVLLHLHQRLVSLSWLEFVRQYNVERKLHKERALNLGWICIHTCKVGTTRGWRNNPRKEEGQTFLGGCTGLRTVCFPTCYNEETHNIMEQ